MNIELENFPEMLTEVWLANREKCWQRYIKEPTLRDLRKKQLELLRNYYFTGCIDESMPYQEYPVTLAYLFPIRSEEGLDYFYRATSTCTLENAESVIRSVEASAIRGAGGGDLEDYKKFFRYHLGDIFSLEGRKYVFKDGQYEHKPKVRDRLPHLKMVYSDYFNHGVTDSFSTDKLRFLYPYFLSCINAIKDDLSSFYNDFYYLFFFMKGYLEQKEHWHSYSEESYAYMLEFIEEIEKPNSDFPQYLVDLWHEVEFEEDDEDCD